MTSPAETSAALAAAQASRGRSGPAWPGAAAPGDAPESVRARRSGRQARAGLEDRLLGEALRARAAMLSGAGPTDPTHALGPVDAASVLWTRFLKYDAADPHWPDRDRFLLSPGYGPGLHSALLQLTAHPRNGDAASFSQGFGAAVGMALAERFLAARFGRSLVDHRTWVMASDGDLMQGVSHEAAKSLPGTSSSTG